MYFNRFRFKQTPLPSSLFTERWNFVTAVFNEVDYDKYPELLSTFNRPRSADTRSLFVFSSQEKPREQKSMKLRHYTRAGVPNDQYRFALYRDGNVGNISVKRQHLSKYRLLHNLVLIRTHNGYPDARGFVTTSLYVSWGPSFNLSKRILSSGVIFYGYGYLFFARR